jgi:hypothetical protein
MSIDASPAVGEWVWVGSITPHCPVWGNLNTSRLSILLYHPHCPLAVLTIPIPTMSGRPSTSSATHTQSAPTVPPAIHNLASPPPSLIDSQLPSYLLPNVLDLLRESTNHVISRKRKEEDTLREEGLLPGKGKGKATPEDEARAVEEETNRKVERIGLMVGSYIAEKCVSLIHHIGHVLIVG